MVKVPTPALPLPPEFVEKRTQFFHDYGAVISLWGEFELCLEVKIAELAGMKPRQASIVLGSLSFGSKSSILYSLLAELGEKSAAAKVSAVINHVQRNALIHGINGTDSAAGTFTFYRREVGSAYIVRHLEYTDEQFHEHLETFRRLHGEAGDALNVDLDSLEEYGREAGLFEPTPQRPPDPRHDEARREKLARKQRQREAQRDRESRT